MKKILLSTTAAIALASAPALAQSATDQIIADLQRQGVTYMEIKQGPTQIKVEAVRDGTKLEVIYDSATGEILRQETEVAEGEYATRTGVEIESDDDEDNEEDDKDDDEDDDEDED